MVFTAALMERPGSLTMDGGTEVPVTGREAAGAEVACRLARELCSSRALEAPGLGSALCLKSPLF